MNSIVSKIKEGKQDNRLSELKTLATKNNRQDVLIAIAERLEVKEANREELRKVTAEIQENTQPSGRKSFLTREDIYPDYKYLEAINATKKQATFLNHLNIA